MIPLALLGQSFFSMKKVLFVVLGVLTVMIAAPVIALSSMTNLDALNDSGNYLYEGPKSTTNTYIFGYCTFWAAKRREEVGQPIPNTWGDAHTWDDFSRLAHYTVDHTPAQYSIMQTDAGNLGHVAFVESVNPDGGWTVSEMNVKGWDVVDGRSFPAAQAQNYNFIH